MPRRLAALVAALALAPLGLAACRDSSDDGGGDRGATPVLSANALADVADTTAAKGTMRMTMRQTMSLGNEGSLPMSGEGVFDTKNHRGEMTMTMDLSSLKAIGAIGRAASTQHVIVDGSTMYMSSPLFAGGLPGGKRWLKVDLAKLGKLPDVDVGSLMQSGSQDPTHMLRFLKGASGDVTKLGRETVRGEPTTHYKATIDFTKIAGAVPASQRAAVRSAMRELVRLGGAKTMPVEVWIGDDGFARRVATDMTITIDEQPTKLSERMEFYDFGTRVAISTPPVSETFDASGLGGEQGDLGLFNG
jgi:hypothetical protein